MRLLRWLFGGTDQAVNRGEALQPRADALDATLDGLYTTNSSDGCGRDSLCMPTPYYERVRNVLAAALFEVSDLNTETLVRIAGLRSRFYDHESEDRDEENNARFWGSVSFEKESQVAIDELTRRGVQLPCEPDPKPKLKVCPYCRQPRLANLDQHKCFVCGADLHHHDAQNVAGNA